MKKIFLITFMFLSLSLNVLATEEVTSKNTTSSPGPITSHSQHGLDIPSESVGSQESDATVDKIDDGQIEYIETTVYENDFSSNCIDFSPAMKIIGIMVLILKIVIPLIIIVMASFNMFKTISSGKSDDFNGVIKKTAFSILGGILIFFAPMIIDLLVGIVTKTLNKPSEYNDINNCKTCIFHPTSEECAQFIELSKDKNYGKEVLISKKVTTTITTMPETTVTRPANIPIRRRWIAHQKNTLFKINDAISKGFYGIEVDVYYDSKTNQYVLKHAGNDVTGAMLVDFLKIAKEYSILAVLHVKDINNYTKLMNVVKENYSLEKVVFMTGSKKSINAIHKANSQARVWYINGALPKDTFNKNLDNEVLEKIEGFAVYVEVVDKDIVSWAHSKGKIVEVFSYTASMSDYQPASKLRGYGVDYLSANEIDDDLDYNREDELQ